MTEAGTPLTSTPRTSTTRTTRAEPGKARCWFVPPLELLANAIARLPQPWLLRLGTALGVLMRPLLGKRRRYARINLALCFPQLDAAQRGRLLTENLRATATGALELLRAWYAPAPALEALAEVEGLEHLRAATASGRGVLLFGGHFVHSELAARLLQHVSGQAVHVVVRRNNNRCLETMFDGARRRAFAGTIAKKDVRGLLRTLSQGGVVAYSADQNFTYQNAFVPFFGIPAATLTATPDLARRGKAVVLPFWFYRGGDGRYRLRIEPQWSGWPSNDPAADAARYMSELEQVVRQHPEQYLWVHRRFKTRPSGEASVYR
jgi:KDO2-lipid IV(A) lauroyltransferase